MPNDTSTFTRSTGFTKFFHWMLLHAYLLSAHGYVREKEWVTTDRTLEARYRPSNAKSVWILWSAWSGEGAPKQEYVAACYGL
jgi:hypothetical protein